MGKESRRMSNNAVFKAGMITENERCELKRTEYSHIYAWLHAGTSNLNILAGVHNHHIILAEVMVASDFLGLTLYGEIQYCSQVT